MIRAGFRRLALIIAGVVGVTVAGSLAIGLAAGSSPTRALTLGFYLGGAGLVALAVFAGGPSLAQGDDLAQFGGTTPRLGTGILIFLGVVLIALGVLVDVLAPRDDEPPPQATTATARHAGY